MGWTLGALLLLAAQQDPSPFTLTINGEKSDPYWVAVGHSGDAPQPGDLLHIWPHLWLTLGPERNVRLRIDNDQVYLDQDGKPGRRIGASVILSVLDHLENLSPEEMKGLWGVWVDAWSPEIAAKVAQIDPARTCLAIGQNFRAPGSRAIPPLPEGLNHLVVEAAASEIFSDFSALRPLTKLRALKLDLIDDPLDISAIAGARDLLYLGLRLRHLTNTDALKGLSRLKTLDLGGCRDLKDISFVSALADLETLNVRKSGVTDLSPLAGLAKLKSVNADEAPIERLPATTLPALRNLRVISTKLTSQAVGAFAKLNPKCRIHHAWEAELKIELVDVTRLRIRSGGTCHRRPEDEKTLFETNDPETIRKAVSLIEIEEDRSGFHCRCCGEPSLEFYAGKELKVLLGFHHGKYLRWPGGWPGDAVLTKESAEGLVQWMAERKVTGPLDERKAAERRWKESERTLARATRGFSDELRRAFTESEEAFEARLKEEKPDAARRIEVLFHVLGASNGSWSSLEWIEQIPDNLLKKAPPETLGPAIEAALLGENRQIRRGAARCWEYSYTLEKWKPKDEGALRRIILDLQLGAAAPYVRDEGISNLIKWKAHVSPDEMDRRLRALLCDPDAGNRRTAVMAAARLDRRGFAPLLLDVAKGTPLKPVPLPPLPAEELEDTEGLEMDFVQLPSERDCAAIALGWFRHEEARATLAKIEPSTPAVEIALALLGDSRRIRAEYFQDKDMNEALMEGALEAVVRCKGEHGLAAAIKVSNSEEHIRPVEVAERIALMLVAEKAPGSEALKDCKEIEPLRAWLTAHGDEYLKRFKR